jgi:hypothetical protein
VVHLTSLPRLPSLQPSTVIGPPDLSALFRLPHRTGRSHGRFQSKKLHFVNDVIAIEDGPGRTLVPHPQECGTGAAADSSSPRPTGCARTSCSACWRAMSNGTCAVPGRRCCLTTKQVQMLPGPGRACSLLRRRANKAAHKHTPDQLPVQSSRDLLRHLATIRGSILPLRMSGSNWLETMYTRGDSRYFCHTFHRRVSKGTDAAQSQH